MSLSLFDPKGQYKRLVRQGSTGKHATRMEWLGYLGVGAVAGVLAGLLGVGGGLVIVPVLLWLFTAQGFDGSIVLHLAIGTSLGTIIATSVSSIRAHHRRGAVRWPLVVRLAPGIVLGALAGAWLADQISTLWLQRVFAVFVITVGVQMLANPRVTGHRDRPGAVGMGLAGTVIGAVSALVGIGGGTLTVPFLMWHRVPAVNAVATSSACGLPIAIAGAFGFVVMGWMEAALPSAATGYLYWPALAGIAAASVVTAPLGAWLAHRLPVPVLKRLFALLLLGVGVRLLWSAAQL